MENRNIAICELDQDEILDPDRFNLGELKEMRDTLVNALDYFSDKIDLDDCPADLEHYFREMYDHLDWITEAIDNHRAR